MFAILLLLLPLQDPAGGVDDLLKSTSGQTPAEALRQVDALGWEAEDALFTDAAARLEKVGGQDLLVLIRLLSWGDELAHPERLVELLNQDPALARAALATMSLESFHLEEELQAALGSWTAEQVLDDAPLLWLEAQSVLYQIGDGTRRRSALRNLRSLMLHEREDVRVGAVLALGRTGTPLGAREVELLEEVALGVDSNAILADTLLERVSEQDRFRAKVEALLRLQEMELGEASATDSIDKGDLEVLMEVLRRAEEQHMEGDRFDRAELLHAAADGMLRRLDPYSNFMPGDEFREFMFGMSGSYGGIGAYVNTVGGVFTLLRPIYSGPAYTVGLRSKDKILAVDGWSTAEQPNDEVIKRLKGEPGTEVKLNVYRAGWSEAKDIIVVRDRIAVPVLQSEVLPGRVLYIELLDFSSDVAVRIARLVQDAVDDGGLNGVVLDLRNNPGGYMIEAVEICDVFLPPGKVVVSTKSRSQPDEAYATRAPALVDADVPLAVLINEYSASASEIVAGALAIHGRAVTVGARTHGKGSVQQLLPISSRRDERFKDENRNRRWDTWEEFEDADGDGEYDYGPRVKLTLSYYYLPDGSSIHTLRDHDGRITQPGGVEPEIAVVFSELEFSTLRELERLITDGVFEEYASTIVEADDQLAVSIAVYDGHDVSLYPGFADWRTGLDTELDDQELRRWVRRRLRDQVSDLRGKVFPGNGFYGDFLEDPQLGAAIREVLAKGDVDTDKVPEYAALLAMTDKAEVEKPH